MLKRKSTNLSASAFFPEKKYFYPRRFFARVVAVGGACERVRFRVVLESEAKASVRGRLGRVVVGA